MTAEMSHSSSPWGPLIWAMPDGVDLLVFGPHPDDLEIGDLADYQFLFRQIAIVFGHKAADEQAKE